MDASALPTTLLMQTRLESCNVTLNKAVLMWTLITHGEIRWRRYWCVVYLSFVIISLFIHHLSLSLSLFFIIFLSDRKSFPPTHNAQQWGRRTCWTTRLVCTRTQAITLPTHASTSLQTACTVVDGTTWQAPWRSKACTTRSKAALPLADGRIPHRQTWCTG